MEARYEQFTGRRVGSGDEDRRSPHAAGVWDGSSTPREQQGLINQGLAGGEPDYIKQAYGAQRGAITDAILRQGGQEQGRADAAAHGLQQGGNYAETLNPLDVGAKLAQQLFSSRTTEAMGNVEQMNKLMGMGMGVGQQAGSAALGAGSNQLRAIGNMADYNQTYAAIMGGVNAAGSVYGAGNQAGWWGPGSNMTTGQMAGGNQFWGSTAPVTFDAGGMMESGGNE